MSEHRPLYLSFDGLCSFGACPEGLDGVRPVLLGYLLDVWQTDDADYSYAVEEGR